MRLFHLSDLHIGKQLHGYNLKDDQIVVFEQIVSEVTKQRPDVIMIAGDIYDKSVPSAEAVNVFDEFLTELSIIEPSIPILIIAGNHDSPERLEFASQILGKNNIYIAGMPPRNKEDFIKKITLTDEFGEIDFYLLPFMKPGYVRNVFEEPIDNYDEALRRIIERENIDYTRRNVLISHQFYTAGDKETVRSDSELISVGGIDNVDISAIAKFDYVALGHIHGPQQVGHEHIRYCGTPLKYSVSEKNHNKAILCVSIGEKNTPIALDKIEFEPIRDVREIKGKLQEVIAAATKDNKDDFISVILKDEDDSLYKPKDQLMDVYSHILEVKVDNQRTRNMLEDADEVEKITDPFLAFEKFFFAMQSRDMTEDEKNIIIEIINNAKESE